MTPPEKVIVVLDRADAEYLCNRIWTPPVPPAWYPIRAALDTDRGELVRRAARAMHDGYLTHRGAFQQQRPVAERAG